MSVTKGRDTTRTSFTDTISEGGSVQGILQKQDAMIDVINAAVNAGANDIIVIDSAATTGGAATENDLTFTGLLATDTVIALSGKTIAGNSVAPIGFADQKAGSLDIVFTADPGAGNVVTIIVLRARSAALTKVDIK